jgi:hypothetical protein
MTTGLRRPTAGWVPSLLCLLAAGAVSEAQTRPERRRPLPTKQPTPPALEFSSPSEGFPPEVKGATNVRILEWKFHPGAMTDQAEAQVRQVALRDTRVRRLLGDRFAYISADEIEPEGKRRRRPEETLPLRLTFFSHSRNAAVRVILTPARTVARADLVKGYQPREGREEIEAAAALVRRDARLRAQTQELSPAGLVIEPRPGRPGHGHRVIHVVFSRGEEDLPRYSALVDLTEQKVLATSEAGKEMKP